MKVAILEPKDEKALTKIRDVFIILKSNPKKQESETKNS